MTPLAQKIRELKVEEAAVYGADSRVPSADHLTTKSWNAAIETCAALVEGERWREYYCVFYDPDNLPVELFGPELWREKSRAQFTIDKMSDQEYAKRYSVKKVYLLPAPPEAERK